jgi:peptide/nickel transport system permease protein
MRTLRRIGSQAFGMLQVLILASMVSFLVLRAMPGDPARLIAGALASEEAVNAIRSQLGIDRPLWEQYSRYIADFCSGNWGYSFSNGAQVSDVLATRFPATLELALYAFVFALVASAVIATWGAYRRRKAMLVGKLASLVGLGTPPFWLALALILIFSNTLKIMPGPSGRLSSYWPAPPTVTGLYTIDTLLIGDFAGCSDALAHLILPAAALAFLPGAFLTRLMTANQLDVASSPFVTVVRSKGISRWVTHRRHIVHNALLPTISSAGMILAQLITGSVLIEQLFNWPGIGQVVVLGIQRQDFAVVQVFILISAVIYVLANLAADIVMEISDPRLRVAAGGSR